MFLFASRLLILWVDFSSMTEVRADFAESRRRLARATKHRTDMIEAHLAAKDEYGVRAHLRQDGAFVSVVTTCPADPLLGTIFGDWLASIRTMLDHVFYQLAIRETGKNPPTRKGDRQFPVCRTQESFDALFEGRTRPLHGFSEAAIEAVRVMQPMNGKYGPDGDAILWFHDLARQDRHREPWKMGGLIVQTEWSIRESDKAGIVGHRKADLETEPPVAGADVEFVPVTFACRSETAAASLANGGIEVDVHSKLELVDWFINAHSKGISANIRNDSLGDRMMFVEYFLGLVIDEFEKTSK